MTEFLSMLTGQPFPEDPHVSVPLDLTPDPVGWLVPYYRFHDYWCESSSRQIIELLRFAVVRETAHMVELREPGDGYWSSLRRGRMVLKGKHGRRYAYPTKEAAWHSFCVRKRKQLAFISASLERAQQVNDLIKEGRVR